METTVTVKLGNQSFDIEVTQGATWTWGVKFGELDQNGVTYRFARGYNSEADAAKALNFQLTRLAAKGYLPTGQVIEIKAAA